MQNSTKWWHKLNWSDSFRISKINPKFQQAESFIEKLPDSFESLGQVVHKVRNEIRVSETEWGKIIIKYFGRIYLINRFAYAWIRPSKAKRSYENALRLLDKEIDTPYPVAFIECFRKGLIRENMYVYLYSPVSRDIRKVLNEPDYPDREKILGDFARFTFSLYQKDVYHKDYSPGNILFEKEGADYHFTLIDINRMRFGKVNGQDRYKVFRRLSAKEDTLRIIAAEYAMLCGQDEKYVTQKIISYSRRFVSKKARKKKWKKALHI